MAGDSSDEDGLFYDEDYETETGDYEVQDDDDGKRWRHCRMYTHRTKQNKVLWYGKDEYEGIGEKYKWDRKGALMDGDGQVSSALLPSHTHTPTHPREGPSIQPRIITSPIRAGVGRVVC